MADIQSNIKVNIDTNGALASLKVLQGQISAFHQEMGRSGALAASEMSRLQNNFMNAVNRSGQFDARMKTIKTTTESFTEALEKNKMSMGQYFRYAGAATKDFGKLFKGEFDTIEKVARERVKDLQTQYIKMGRDANGAMKAISVRPLMLDLDDLSTKTQIAAQKQQLLNQLLKQGSTNMLNWGKNTQWAGRQLMVGFTIPLTMLGQIASKTFMEMEESVIKFQRVYGDFSTTTQQTKEMTAEVTNLAKAFTKYGLAVSDTVGMAASAAAMGKQGADLLAQVESASRLSVLGGIDQQQALETTISLTNAFGIASDKLKGKIDFLNVVENQTVTSIEDLTIAIPKAAPVIQQLGGDVEDLAFFLTAMKEGGINASEGANALKSGLASIINPTKKASDMLAGFGINIKGIVDANKGDVKGMIMGVAESLNTLDPLKRAQAIEQLFGKFQFARISTLFKNITDVNSQATRVSQLAEQGPGAAAVLAQRELQKIEDSPMFKFKKALEDLQTQLIPLGEQFIKAITPIAKFFTDILTNFNNLSGGTKDFIGGMTIAIAGVGPVALMVIGLIANGIANMIKLFASVKSFFNNLGKGTQDLGSQTAYMTQEQVEAQAVAASLEQTHSKLTQTFTSEAGAIAKLRSEMERAVAVQNQFNWSGNPATAAKPKRAAKKMANGGMVRGPGGPKDDLVPTDLSNGEAVIDADTVRKNPRIISALFSGKKINIPGYAENNSRAVRVPASPATESTPSQYETVFAHIAEPIAMSLEDFAKRLVDLGKKVPADIQRKLDAGLGKATVRTYGGFGFDTKQSYNDAMKTGGPGVVPKDFLKDFEGRGSDKWATSLKVAGLKMEDVSGDLAILDKSIADQIRNAQKLDKNFVVTDKAIAEFTEVALKPLRKNGSQLAAGFDRARNTVTEVRGNATQGILSGAGFERNKERGAGYYSGPSGETVKAGRLVKIGGGAKGKTARGVLGGATMSDFADGATPAQEAPSTQPTQAEQAVPKAEGKRVAKKKAEAFDAGLIEQGQVQSPSKVTKQIGANYGKGFIVGAEQGIKSTPVASPAAIQHARDQLKRILQPYSNPQGIINTEKLNRAYMVQVHLVTENEKRLREASRMLMVSDQLMRPFTATVDALGDAAMFAKEKISQGVTSVKTFAAQVPTAIKTAMTTAATAVKTGVERLKTSLTQLATKIQQTAISVGKGAVAQLGGGKGMMATAAVGGTLSMMPGKVGEIASAILMPLMMIQSVVALIPATMMAAISAAIVPILAIAAPLVILGGLIAFAIWQNAENNKKAAEFGTALAVSSESVKKFGEITGRVGITEGEQAESDARRAGLSNIEDLQFGKDYVTSDQGKADVSKMEELKDKKELSPAQVAQQYSATLAQAITQGTLTLTEANSIAAAVGEQLGDSSFSILVNSELESLLGPDGKNILKDPLVITTKLIQANTETADYLLDNAVLSQEESDKLATDNFVRDNNAGYAVPEGTAPGEAYTVNKGLLSEATYYAPTAQQLDDSRLEGQGVGDVKDDKQARAAYTAYLGSYGSIQTTVDSGLAAIDEKIENKRADFEKETDGTKKKALKVELDALESSRDDDRAAIFASGDVQRQKMIGLAGKINNNDAFDAAVEVKKNTLTDESEKTALNTRKDEIKGVTNEALRSILQGGLLSDSIGARDSSKIVEMSKEGGGVGDKFANAYTGAVSSLGDREATELTGTLAARGANTATTSAALIGASANNGQKAAGYRAALQDNNMSIDLGVEGAAAQLNKFATTYTNTIKDLKGKSEVKLVATAIQDKKVQKLIENSKVFKGLNKQQKITYLAKYNATMALQGDPSINKAWKDWQAKQGGGDVSFPAFARYLAGEAGQAAPKTTESKDTGGNTTGGTAPTKTDKANAALSLLGRKEEKINKAYDERVKALDAIQKANDRINQQQKDQLDLADALSKGDIGAAAKAQQQARQNAQATALQQQQEQMSAARDAQIASLRVNGMSRAGLEAFLNKESDKSDKKTLGGWRFSTGGMVPKTQYFATGGKPRGTDTIAAMLTPGEFVVKKSAVDSLGAGTMNKINSGKLPSKGNSMYNYSVMINVKSDADADQIAKTVIAEIQKIDNQSMKGNDA
jgi:TP901 family phage tail tape measure protein